VNYAGAFKPLTLWNPRHLLAKELQANADAWNWAESVLQDSLDPLPLRTSLLANPGRAAAWIIRMIQSEATELWNGLNDRDPSFLDDVWRLLFPTRNRRQSGVAAPILTWREESMRNCLNRLTPEGWSIIMRHEEIVALLPPPGDDWTLRVSGEGAVFPI
jgi:hypothetical protein